jgi:hypothetical protein
MWAAPADEGVSWTEPAATVTPTQHIGPYSTRERTPIFHRQDVSDGGEEEEGGEGARARGVGAGRYRDVLGGDPDAVGERGDLRVRRRRRGLVVLVVDGGWRAEARQRVD